MTQAKALLEEIPIPDIAHLVLEDDTPVDNFQSEKQQRCLIDPLYSTEVLPCPFLAAANVEKVPASQKVRQSLMFWVGDGNCSSS